MIPQARPIFTVLLLAVVGTLGCSSGKPQIDLGDGASGSLVFQTFHHGFALGDRQKGIAYADAALDLHGDEARREQASLSAFPSTEPPSDAYRYSALNNVAIALIGKGALQLREGDRTGAEATFKMVVDEFGYAQSEIEEDASWLPSNVKLNRDANGFVKLAGVAEAIMAEMDDE